MKDEQTETIYPGDVRRAERAQEVLNLQGQFALAILLNDDVKVWAREHPQECDYLLRTCASQLKLTVHSIVRTLLVWGDISDRQMRFIQRSLRNL